jgi:hypothetical protein
VTVRYAASVFPYKQILGVTDVHWQVGRGNSWNRRVGFAERARLELADYTGTGLAPASVDGAIAAESGEGRADGQQPLRPRRQAASSPENCTKRSARYDA